MDLPTPRRTGDSAWVDVAGCTLPTAERPLRLAEFDDLFATSLRSIERTGAYAVRMLLAGDAGLVARTQALADAELTCCSFFAFGVTPLEGERVALDVSVPAANVEVLDGLVGRAAATLGGAA
jgi:hypothetical protein